MPTRQGRGHKWIEDIQNTPQPGTKKEVQSILVLIGWYQKFVPQFAIIAVHLIALICKDSTIFPCA